MIPLVLRLRNFMSYRENVPPLLFDGFHVACLSGENGHGKSALLDAITWALWGKARAKSEDELIHHGKTEMEVEFEFALGESRYRVLRKRALRRAGGGLRGVGALDLQVGADGGYRSIAGDTMHETQRRINELLRMEYDTFVNSAFILQGKADAFTLRTPAERKKVLADLLGLEVYSTFEETARERAREREAQRREELARVRSMESEAARRPEYEEEAVRVAAELAELAQRLSERERFQALLREEKHSLEQDAARLQEIDAQQKKAERELADAERQLADRLRQIAACEATLSRREEVEAGYATLLALREEDKRFSEASRQLVSLNQRESKLARAVDEARARLQADHRALLAEVATLERRRQGVAEWQAGLAKVKARLAELDGLEAEREEKRARIQSLKYQVDTLHAVNEQLRKDMTSLKEKIELLADGEGRCPLCTSELGEHERQHLVDQYRAEGLRMRHDYDQNAAAIKEMEEEAEREKRAIAALETALRDKVTLERKAATLEKSLADAAEAEAQIEEKAAAAAAVAGKLERHEYAQAEQEALAALREEIAALGYDGKAHEALQARLAAHAHYEELHQVLELAESRLAQERPLAEGLERLRDRWRSDLVTLAERRKEFEERLKRLPALAAELSAVEREINELIDRHAEAKQREGRAQQMVKHCRYLEEQCAELMRNVNRLTEEKQIFDELAVAFGKKGIQAMIIEAAVPELEDEANELLSRMTDGRMRVKFETQRAAKSSDNVIETLDIRIADELGTRSYELFSGGEAFKVNFAIRIALSKLLARRAGARLETLVIDEGFGTQDAQGRERLVEAINTVSNDFAKILVITHIEDLKDAFPVRIDIVKTPDGSQIILD